jgi:hypothetical protein
MPYTLGQAAKAAGTSKPTLSRAIKSGRLSAQRQPDGSFLIDPAELHRVYPPAAATRNDNGNAEHPETPDNPLRHRHGLKRHTRNAGANGNSCRPPSTTCAGGWTKRPPNAAKPVPKSAG